MLKMNECLKNGLEASVLTLKITLCMFLGFFVIIVCLIMLRQVQNPLRPDYIYVLADVYTTSYEYQSIDWLVRPNVVSILAQNITEGCETDICKAEMLHKFMEKNWKYEVDGIHYRSPDVWNPPEITLGRGVMGDCDDSAILIESLAQNMFNESYMLLNDNHIFNLICLDGNPVVLDQVDIFFGEDAENYIIHYKVSEFYDRDYRFWTDNFEDISCLNYTKQNI